MKYSEVKQIIEFCESNGIDHRTVIEMMGTEDDFEVDDYRFINEQEIDEIQEMNLLMIAICWDASRIGL